MKELKVKQIDELGVESTGVIHFHPTQVDNVLETVDGVYLLINGTWFELDEEVDVHEYIGYINQGFNEIEFRKGS